MISGKLSSGEALTVTNPVAGFGKKVSPPIGKFQTYAPCTYAVTFPDGDEIDGEMLVTVAFHYTKKDRIKHRAQKLLDSL